MEIVTIMPLIIVIVILILNHYIQLKAIADKADEPLGSIIFLFKRPYVVMHEEDYLKLWMEGQGKENEGSVE